MELFSNNLHAEAESISEQRYLKDAAGEYLVDPASLDRHGAFVLMQISNSIALCKLTTVSTNGCAYIFQNVVRATAPPI